MEYLLACRNVINRTSMEIVDKEQNLVATVTFNKKSDKYPIEIYNTLEAKHYYIKSNPLRFKGRFLIFDAQDNQLAKINLGVKIIHSIIEKDKYYFVKAAFWKIKYQVYDNRTIINDLSVLRHNKKRYYKIFSKDGDFVNVIALFLVARAVRIRALM